MSLSYDEAYTTVTGPGQVFELVEQSVDGVDYRMFKNAPPVLGQVFAGATSGLGTRFSSGTLERREGYLSEPGAGARAATSRLPR